MIKLELCAVEVTNLLIALEHRQTRIHERLAADEPFTGEALRMESDELFELHAKLQDAAAVEGFKL